MLTIIFATFNGGDTIGRMLQRFCELTPPKVDIEILMVNNGSSDSTVEVAQSFVDKLPLKILHESKRGKNRALNHGVESAKGDLLLFTDDDILPDKDWLVKVWDCSEANRNVDLFGGRILPYWEKEPSPDFLESVPLTAAYGITPAELPEGPVPAGAIWGANMFVRKRVFEKGFRFDEHVGPGPGHYIMGSETEFNLRVASHGYTTWYCPDAIVQHIIFHHETSIKWLKNRACKFGKGRYARNHEEINKGQITTFLRFQLNSPRWMIRKFISEWLLAIKSKLLGDNSGELKHIWSAYDYWGYLAQGLSCKKIAKAVTSPKNN